MSVSGEFAALAAELGLGTYHRDATGGTIYLTSLPPEPDAAIAVQLWPGGPSDAHHGYDEPLVMFRVRGPRGDPEAAEEAAQGLYDALHGLRRRNLPGGAVMLSCHGSQGGPIYADADEHGRHEWNVMFTVELRRRTANRV